MVLELIVRALCLNSTVLHNDDMVSKVDKLDGMSNQNSRLSVHEATEDLMEDVLAHMGVESRDRVIHNEHVGASIDSASECKSCLLAT